MNYIEAQRLIDEGLEVEIYEEGLWQGVLCAYDRHGHYRLKSESCNLPGYAALTKELEQLANNVKHIDWSRP